MQLDRDHVWHPYTDFTNPGLITPVSHAQGVELHLADGRVTRVTLPFAGTVNLLSKDERTGEAFIGLVGWLVWWLFKRFGNGRVAQSPLRWFWAMQLALVTHPLLDAMTVYGTQLWWPLRPWRRVRRTPAGCG